MTSFRRPESSNRFMCVHFFILSPISS